MGEYRKSAIIKYTRRAKGMTQEELAENICDPVTISRYENGLLNPSDDRFARLMQRMGESGDIYSFPIQCETVTVQNKMKELLYMVEKKDWTKVKQIKETIEKEYQVSTKYVENQQYLKRVEIVMRLRNGEICRKKAIAELEKLIQMTIPEYREGEFADRVILQETEILLLNNIATYSEEDGDFEKAGKIFEKLYLYIIEAEVVNDSKPRYIVNTNYSNFLGLTGRYDESIEVCKEEIRYLIKNNCIICLYNLYFNIGWNLVQKIKHKQEDKEKLNEAKCYIWISYQLCQMYPENKRDLPIIMEFYNSLENEKFIFDE